MRSVRANFRARATPTGGPVPTIRWKPGAVQSFRDGIRRIALQVAPRFGYTLPVALNIVGGTAWFDVAPGKRRSGRFDTGLQVCKASLDARCFTVGQRDMFVAAFISSAVFELTDSCARRLVLDKMTFRRAMPCRELAFE
jgi:hypothetical protein